MDAQLTAYELSAFTDRIAAGSPTGVVLEAGGLTPDQMGRIARELGFSHTAFVTESHEDGYDLDIRFFTPAGEIRNCGHATIAAHVLRAIQKPISGDTLVRQRTLSGVQEVEVRQRAGAISVHFRQNEIRFSEVDRETVAVLLPILGLREADLPGQYPVMLASPGANRFMVAVNSPATLFGLTPDLPALKRLCDRFESIGCFVFHVGPPAPTVEAVARMFAPAIGVDEDIVNGNSSGCLGAYLLHLDSARRMGPELSLSVHQGHAFDRPGTVLVSARRLGDRIETTVGGTAVIVRQLSLADQDVPQL